MRASGAAALVALLVSGAAGPCSARLPQPVPALSRAARAGYVLGACAQGAKLTTRDQKNGPTIIVDGNGKEVTLKGIGWYGFNTGCGPRPAGVQLCAAAPGPLRPAAAGSPAWRAFGRARPRRPWTSTWSSTA